MSQIKLKSLLENDNFKKTNTNEMKYAIVATNYYPGWKRFPAIYILQATCKTMLEYKIHKFKEEIVPKKERVVKIVFLSEKQYRANNNLYRYFQELIK